MGDLEALSNERPMAEGEERTTVGTHGGATPDGRRTPMTRVTQKIAALMNPYLNHFN